MGEIRNVHPLSSTSSLVGGVEQSPSSCCYLSACQRGGGGLRGRDNRV